MKKLILPILIVQICFISAYSADFLTGARGSGTGFSFFALGDDPSGALYNPASIAFITGWQTQIMYNKGHNYGYTYSAENPYYGLLGAVYYKPEWGSFSLNSIQSGSFYEFTNIPTVNHVVFSFGREFSPGLALGASIKYVGEYGFLERSAFDFDLGITYRSMENIILAAAAENIVGSELTPAALGFSENLPRRGRLGGAYIMENDMFQAAFTLAGQLEQSGIAEDQTTFLGNLGSEWWFNRFGKLAFGARFGYTLGKGLYNDIKSDYNGAAAGFSLNYDAGTNNIRLDYSWKAFPYDTNDNSLHGDHYIALNLGWGGVPDYSRYEPEEEFVEYPIQEPDSEEERQESEEYVDEIPDNTIDRDTDFDTEAYERYSVDMDVADISSINFKRIVFYMRPQEILRTSFWKLYIFKAKIKSWNEDEIDRWALKLIEGRGLPPLNVVWDGISRDGKLLPEGKYYFILTARDPSGRNFATKWHSFKLD